MRPQTIIRSSVAGVLLTALTASAQTTAPSTLGLGDAAPAIKVAAWAKGTPVTAFEPGQVYVVEFWATWCGPCKRSIPHLTELAKQYAGKATFVGVAVWEHPDEETDAGIKDVVLPFVKSMGDKMDYNVAIDGTAGVMAATWLKAAGQEFIPASYVIDGQGRIAWTGLPTELGPVLEKVTSGQWDIAGEKKRRVDAAAAEAPRKAAMDAIDKAFKAKDDKAILAAIDAAEAKFPGTALHPDLISVKLEALFRSDPAAAVAYVKTLTGSTGTITQKPNFVWSVVRVVPDTAGKVALTPADWKAIAVAVGPAVKSTEPFAWMYEKYSILLGLAGDRDAAIANQSRAVELATAYNASHAGQIGKADTDALARLQKRLASLQAGS